MKDSTRRTIRTTLAVTLAIAAALPVLVAEAGLDVAAWPWLGVVLAVAAGITRVMASPVVERFLLDYVPWLASQPDGRHEAGRVEDGGYTRPGAIGAFAAAGALILAGTFLLAGDAAAHRSVAHIRVTYSRYCDGGLTVQYDRERLASGAWEPSQDDGTVRVELHHLGAAAGPGGAWVPLPAGRVLQRADNYVMVDVRGLRVWDQVRVAYQSGRGGWVASSPALQPRVVCVWVGRSGEAEAAVKP